MFYYRWRGPHFTEDGRAKQITHPSNFKENFAYSAISLASLTSYTTSLALTCGPKGDPWRSSFLRGESRRFAFPPPHNTPHDSCKHRFHLLTLTTQQHETGMGTNARLFVALPPSSVTTRWRPCPTPRPSPDTASCTPRPSAGPPPCLSRCECRRSP